MLQGHVRDRQAPTALAFPGLRRVAALAYDQPWTLFNLSLPQPQQQRSAETSAPGRFQVSTSSTSGRCKTGPFLEHFRGARRCCQFHCHPLSGRLRDRPNGARPFSPSRITSASDTKKIVRRRPGPDSRRVLSFEDRRQRHSDYSITLRAIRIATLMESTCAARFPDIGAPDKQSRGISD